MGMPIDVVVVCGCLEIKQATEIIEGQWTDSERLVWSFSKGGIVEGFLCEYKNYCGS